MATKTRPTGRRSASRDVRQLVHRGWSRRDANALLAVDDAVSMASHARAEKQRLLAHRVAEALRRQPVASGAEVLLTKPELEHGWRMLAQWLEGDDRLSLLRMAAASAGGEAIAVTAEEAASLVNEEDLHVLTAARAAEARGDFARAEELLGSVPRPLDDGWRLDLQTLLVRGDLLSPAVWGRWICSAAVRHCLDIPSGLAAAEHFAALVLDACGGTSEEIRDLTLPRALHDQVVHDVLLFDLDGLGGYLDGPLDPAVKDRVPGIDAWPEARLGVVRLQGRGKDGSALCRDVRSGLEIVVGDERLADEHPPGRCFIGRLARIDGDSRSWFAMRPTVLDDLTASRVATVLAEDVSVERRLVELHRGLRRPSSV